MIAWVIVIVVFVLAMSSLLFRALLLQIRQHDRAAAYPLFAIRDRIVAAVVFDGVSRDDPWVQASYGHCVSLLRGCAILDGPKGWARASAIGRHIAKSASQAQSRAAFPVHEPIPEPLRPVLEDFRGVIESVSKQHIGVGVLYGSEARERRQKQVEEARALQASLHQLGIAG